MYGTQLSPRERVVPMVATSLVVALIGWALILGLGVARGTAAGESLATFDVVATPPPPVRVVPQRVRSHRPAGRAAPAGRRAQATPIVAPPLPAIVPPPVTVAPVAGVGLAPTQGAAARGSGPGAGGIGDGRGSGGAGDGDGGPGFETEPRWLRGRLSFRDGAKAVGEAVIGRALTARCTLEVNTRLTGCVVARSSGLRALDEAVCRLIEERFRYTPWLDPEGRAVRSTILIDQSWEAEG